MQLSKGPVLKMYRLKLISPDFGIDDRGPLHPSREQARQAAELMMLVYKGRLRVEIHRITDTRSNKTEKVEELITVLDGVM